MLDSYDAIIVGGSYAGLAAALQLGRARRRVLVVDAGSPRNRFSARAHAFLTQDGRPGSAIKADALAQMQPYTTVRVIKGGAVHARMTEGGNFEVDVKADAAPEWMPDSAHEPAQNNPPDGMPSGLHGMQTFSSRRLLLATGVADVLPDLPGLQARWGSTVLHCPYCHGYELGGGPIGVLASGPASIHQALLVADWGDVTLFVNNAVPIDARSAAMLARRKVTVETTAVVALEGQAPGLEAVLADGRRTPLRAMFAGVPIRLASDLGRQLGCATVESPFGDVLQTDAMKLTSVAGVYAAGDAGRMQHSISLAVADGTLAGVWLHQSLVAQEASVD